MMKVHHRELNSLFTSGLNFLEADQTVGKMSGGGEHKALLLKKAAAVPACLQPDYGANACKVSDGGF
jgi:hypothetical protein